MTREQARKLASVMLSFGGGEAVQYLSQAKGKWVTDPNPNFTEALEWRVFDPIREFRDALSSGKPVEQRLRGGIGKWYEVPSRCGWGDEFEYRLKPETKYRPFTASEILLNQCCMATRHQNPEYRTTRAVVTSVRPASDQEPDNVSVSGIGGFTLRSFLEICDLCDSDGKNVRPAGVLLEAGHLPRP